MSLFRRVIGAAARCSWRSFAATRAIRSRRWPRRDSGRDHVFAVALWNYTARCDECNRREQIAGGHRSERTAIGGGAKVAADSTTGEGAAKVGVAATDPESSPEAGQDGRDDCADGPRRTARAPAPKPQSTEHESRAGSLAEGEWLAQNEGQKTDATKPEAAPVPRRRSRRLSSRHSLPCGRYRHPRGYGRTARRHYSPRLRRRSTGARPLPRRRRRLRAMRKRIPIRRNRFSLRPIRRRQRSRRSAVGPEHVAKTNPMPEPPADLWLPDGRKQSGRGEIRRIPEG